MSPQPPTTTRAVVLAHVPDGVPTADDFTLAERPVPSLTPGQVLLRVLDLSLDPYVRSALGGSHLGDRAVGVGDLVPGRSVAEVVASTDPSRDAGDLVLAETGWVEHAVLEASATTPVTVPDGVPVSAALGALGMPGLTAYAAVRRHVRPRPGETVLVTSATGGVGAVAGQLVGAAGARAVAVVGSEEKARLATTELGYAAAVLRSSPRLAEDLREACPAGIDGYLHMGDQATLDVVMEQLAVGARVSLIGVPDQTNGAAPTRLRVGAVMAARAELHGMVVYDHHDLAADHVAEVGARLADGTFTVPEARSRGLDSAGEAFAAMMRGDNVGKVVVEVAAR